MIKHKYGEVTSKQIESYKTKLRKKLFWLIIYKDENTNKDYKNVDVESYQINLMKQMDGFNSIMNYPSDMVDVMSILEAALIELCKDNFDFNTYKKLVFDAGSLI